MKNMRIVVEVEALGEGHAWVRAKLSDGSHTILRRATRIECAPYELDAAAATMVGQAVEREVASWLL